jgi:pyruvate-ferredoxin/flavodoxin oxidoreductase
MQQRFTAHTDRLGQLIGGLEDLVQGNISDTVSINDFDEFSRRLSRLDHTRLNATELANLVRDEGARQEIDPDSLRRQSALAVELKKRLQQYSDTDTGKGRARLLFAVDPEASSFWSGTYPYNPYWQPWICHIPGGHATGLAASMAESIRRTLLEDIKLYRRAELELNGCYDPALHDPVLDTLGWGDLNEIEQQLAPPIFLICRNHEHLHREIATLLTGRYPIRIVSIDQDGLLVSGSESKTAYTRLSGDFDHLHRPQSAHLVVQTSVGQPGHLIRSVSEMLAFDGPSLLSVYAPDPHVNGFAIEKCIEQAALAVKSRTFPLFRILRQAGQQAVSIEDNPAADDDWPQTDLIVRAPGGQETILAKKITVADWAINESRYQKHFNILAKGHLNETMTPLADYLDLDAGQRETLQAYIDIANDKQQHLIAIVSAEMVGACELARNKWRRLQLLASASEVTAKPVQPKPAAEPQGEIMQQPPEPDLSAYQQLTSRLLELCGYSQDTEFFNQSLSEFIRKDNRGGATGPENEQVETSE